MLKLKIKAEGHDMIYFFSRTVEKNVGLFCPWVPVAKYSLFLLFKKTRLFLIVSTRDKFFTCWVVRWIKKMGTDWNN